MATHTATVQLSNGTLTMTRPHPAPQIVDDLVDDMVWKLRDSGGAITSLGFTIVTADDAQQAPEPLPADNPDQLTVEEPAEDTGSRGRRAAQEPVQG